MIIDVFTHVYPKSYLSALPASARDRGLEAYLDYVPAFTDAASRIQVMDRLGIQFQVLTLGYPPALENLNDATAIQIARLANDAIAEFVQAFPDRFIGAATLPLHTPAEALAELKRCQRELGLHAIQIFTNVNGRPLDWEGLIPIYAIAADEQIPILLHPINAHVSYNWIGEHKLDRLFGWPFETTLALSRLVFGGILERFPTLKIIAHHAGSMISFYQDRIFSYAHPDSPMLSLSEKNRISETVIATFKMFYVDTVQAWKPALQCASEFFGPEHVVYGSDFPWGPEGGERYIQNSLAAIEALDVTLEERRRILADNARVLFGVASPC
ncbi:MAG: amidohydrolase [Chloroflexi bacterium]|nr:amidohydrolase [Chloroflexota bacterium]